MQALKTQLLAKIVSLQAKTEGVQESIKEPPQDIKSRISIFGELSKADSNLNFALASDVQETLWILGS